MKTQRFVLAVAITMAAAACSTDVTAPDAVLRAPVDAQENTAPDPTPTTTTPPPAPAEEDDGGLVGSGVGR
jgi:hypothetical protein